MMQIVRLLLCIVGLFVHCHKTHNRIQSRCDVGLHVCKYNEPTAKSILFIYVKSHRVTFCEKAFFRQLALALLSGDVALNPGPMKFGFANCQSIRNNAPTLCEEVKTGNFDVFGLTETHIKALDTPSFLNELTPEDFSLVHTNRENKCGGSVGFFIKSALDFKTIHSPEFSSLENHTVSLTFDGRRMFLGVVYLPHLLKNFLKIFCHMWVFCLPYPPSLSFVVTLIFMSTLCLQQSLNLNQSWILAVCPNTLIFQLTFMVIP